MFEQYEDLRDELLRSQEVHISSFQNNGFTTLEGLNDWRSSFKRITDGQHEILKQIKEFYLNFEKQEQII